jgi:hypothetical protein
MEPHVYRPGKGWLMFTVGVGVAMIILGIISITIISFPAPGVQVRAPIWIGYLFCSIAISMGGFIAAGMIANRVFLYTDAIEVAGLFNSRRLERREIGAKMVMAAGCLTYVLYPWSKDKKRLMVGVVFPLDAAFRDWMEGIPDADKAFFRGRRDGTLKPRDSN